MTKNIALFSLSSTCIPSLAALSVLALLTVGCENANQVDSASWNDVANKESPTTPTDSPTDTPPGTTTSGDAVSYSSFNWIYGGFNGAKASHSGVSISSLRYSGNTLFFNYDTDLSAWGLASGDHTGALACLFVKNTAGQWVGGKFDWISSSRTSRGLEHCLNGYNGWSMSGIPNPCEAAFVIVSPDGRRRSNALVGTWTR